MLVRVNTSHFDFTCPACGELIGEDDVVWTLRFSALVSWPVCEECGMEWCADQVPDSDRD